MDTWLDDSEKACGLLIMGRQNINHFRPEIFQYPYSDVVTALQEGLAKEDLIIRCGTSTITAAIEAGKSLNGLSKADWPKILTQSYLRHNVGTALESIGKKLQRGAEIDAPKILDLVSQLDKEEGDLVPLSEIEPKPVPFIKTGYYPIDKELGGIPEVGLVQVAGTIGVGKSTFLVKLAADFVREHPDKQVVIFTLEMVLSEFATRALEVNRDITEDEKKRIIICEKVLTSGELANKAARVTNLGLIGIDFADLLVPGEVEERQMAVVYKTIAAMAKQLKVPVILLTQYNRSYQGGIPRPHHVRYTSLSEALSWMILMLYAPWKDYFAEEETSGKKKVVRQTLPVVKGKGYILAWKCRGGFRKHSGPGAIQVNLLGETGWGEKNPKWFSLEKGEDDDEAEEDE